LHGVEEVAEKERSNTMPLERTRPYDDAKKRHISHLVVVMNGKSIQPLKIGRTTMIGSYSHMRRKEDHSLRRRVN
jgi:hypothetical protein